MVKMFNLYYFIFLLSGIAIFFAIYFLFRKSSYKTKYNFLLGWLFVCFALHFLKQLAPGYDIPQDLHKSTFENICAVSTLVFPFIFMIKKDSPLHDFMFFIGVIGGLAAFIYPTEALNEKIWRFETFRFYFCHFSLFAIPILTALFDVYRPKLKRFWMIPLFFLCYELIIFVNEAILVSTGLMDTTLQEFFNRDVRNNSFVFGPTSDTGSVGQIIASLCPDFMKVDIFGIVGGGELYWPVIWLACPVFILFIPIYLLMALPFCKEIRDKKIKKKDATV